MSAWTIAEWYGKDIQTMTSDQRLHCSEIALRSRKYGVKNTDVPTCPFLSNVKPSSPCNKLGGVCSIRDYSGENPTQPATVCPNRFLERIDGQSIFGFLAETLYGVTKGAKVIKEIPFLHKLDADGSIRATKAGRIDWVLIPNPPTDGDTSPLDWIAIETQAVYFSGANMWDDIEAYQSDPTRVHSPSGARRPDYRSSGAKRLAPQLHAKSPVMRRWGHKVAVVVDQSFFDELASMPRNITDFDNAEVVWVVVKYSEAMNLYVSQIQFAELDESIAALQSTEPMVRKTFEDGLRNELWRKSNSKVSDA